ncbi:hypothetical protein DICVIV_08097 [Dictyocaulus viviparus]|uniref:7TM GPCR serpentine receptor class x (Srx) domain-containing protein n=1 Tax=Dictyocaulus viviparus TaxID=29172 RepID=A0A0D8XQ18_DICVI|nr:hypothetical protein DICVIV_08097 [Dictyocaulus viviparus]
MTGIICNVLAFFVIIRHHVFRNPFGYLTAYQAFFNTGLLFMLTIWAVPWTLLPLPQQLHWLNFRIGQLCLFFEEITFHCSLFIAINRYMAITFPVRYRIFFTTKTTYSIILSISLISALYSSVYFKGGCDFYFDHNIRIWTFGSEPCSIWLSFYIDMIYNVGLFIIIEAKIPNSLWVKVVVFSEGLLCLLDCFGLQ